MPANRVLLGHISQANGLRGAVLIKSYTEDPADIVNYGPLQDESGERAFKLRLVRVSPKGIIAKVDGITDRTGAEALRGTKLYIDREHLPQTDEESFYHHDLVGLAVKSIDDEPIGKVVAVQNFGAGDLLEIKLTGTKNTEYLPFDETFVPTIDIAKSELIVRWPVSTDDDDDEEHQHDDNAED